MALTDVYCLLNRALGTALISPDDLVTAAEQLEQLNLPMRLRKFDSGVMVIQSVEQNDETVAKRILSIVEKHGPQTSLDIARTLSISVALAKEQLLTAERMGILCRDETFEGLVFYVNFFTNY